MPSRQDAQRVACHHDVIGLREAAAGRRAKTPFSVWTGIDPTERDTVDPPLTVDSVALTARGAMTSMCIQRRMSRNAQSERRRPTAGKRREHGQQGCGLVTCCIHVKLLEMVASLGLHPQPLPRRSDNSAATQAADPR